MNYNLNNTITNLWNSFSDEFASFDCMKRMPNYYSKPIKGKLLFIGLNPAFQSKNKDSLIFASIVSAERMNEIAVDNENSKTKPNPKGKGNYYARYFDILHEVSDVLIKGESDQKKFEHCDMFLMRETDSKIVKNMVENEKSDLHSFGLEQIEILKSYINDAEPSIIIIPNSMSANYYKKYVLENQPIDEKKGVYYTEINKRKVPTILCGSWQYGRLDRFTKEILLGHLTKVMLSHK
jgi:hypothetical protein